MSLETSTKVRNSLTPVITARFVVLTAALSVVVAVVPIQQWWLRLLVVDVTLVVVAIADAMMASAPSRVDVVRSLPPIVAMGAESELTWSVRNPARRRLHVEVADELPPSWRADRRRIRLTVPSRGKRTGVTAFRPERRGRFVVRELTVRTTGPLGLGGRQGTRQDESVLRVYPPFHSRKDAELRIEQARILEVGMRSVRSRGGGTEFEQLREYGPDDDFRRMDWAATARAAKPIVRTYRSEQNQNVFVLLDCGRVMAGQVDEVVRLEHAIDAAMAVTTVASRLGDKVGLITFDSSVGAEVGLGRGTSHIARINEAIYGVQPSLVESSYQTAFVRMMARTNRRSLVILLTEPDDGALEETLLPALPIVLRSHMLVVAGVADPDVNSWSRSVPTDVSKAHQKAAAVAALEARRHTSAILRSRGATVINAEPGKLASGVADAYLEAKASGRL